MFSYFKPLILYDEIILLLLSIYVIESRETEPNAFSIYLSLYAKTMIQTHYHRVSITIPYYNYPMKRRKRKDVLFIRHYLNYGIV